MGELVRFLRNPNVQFWSCMAMVLIWVPVALLTDNLGLIAIGGVFVWLAITTRVRQTVGDEQRQRLQPLVMVAIAAAVVMLLARIVAFVLPS